MRQYKLILPHTNAEFYSAGLEFALYDQPFTEENALAAKSMTTCKLSSASVFEVLEHRETIFAYKDRRNALNVKIKTTDGDVGYLMLDKAAAYIVEVTE